MSSQVISFRASGEFLSWLQSQQQEDESLSQTASRLLKGASGKDSSPSCSQSKSKPTVDSNVDSVDKEWFQDLVKEYYAQAMTNLNGAVGELRAEFSMEIDQRLGELQTLRKENENLRRENETIKQQADKPKLTVDMEAIINSINYSLQFGGEKILSEREKTVLRKVNYYLANNPEGKYVSETSKVEVRLRELEKIRDRILTALKVGKQSSIYKAAAKALNAFIAEL